MKIVNEFPPIWDMVRIHFPEIQNYKPVFAYGNFIYNPFNQVLPDDLIFHEEVHSKQQRGKPREWWTRYCLDKAFREEMEVDAYAYQLNFIREKVPKAEKEFLEEFSTILSSSLYDLGTTYDKIYTKIRLKAKELNG